MSTQTISIHAPRAGARLRFQRVYTWLMIFQSTRPVRGRDILHLYNIHYFHISIHAPRAGARRVAWWTAGLVQDFNPRAPCGGAT